MEQLVTEYWPLLVVAGCVLGLVGDWMVEALKRAQRENRINTIGRALVERMIEDEQQDGTGGSASNQ